MTCQPPCGAVFGRFRTWLRDQHEMRRFSRVAVRGWPRRRNRPARPRGGCRASASAARSSAAWRPGVAGFARVDEQGPLQRIRRRHLPRALGRDLRHARQRPLRTGLVGRAVPAHARHRRGLAPTDVVAPARRDGPAVRSRDVLRRPGISRPGQASGAQKVRQLSDARSASWPGGLSESNLTTYFRSHKLTLRKILIQPRNWTRSSRPDAATPSRPTSRSWDPCGARCGSLTPSAFCRSRSPGSRSRSWCVRATSICSTSCAGRFSP